MTILRPILQMPLSVRAEILDAGWSVRVCQYLGRYGADLLDRAGADLPVETGTFNMVLSMNTIEHVYDLGDTLQGLIRVLKPGGRLVLAVPFLFRMHGCPEDYNRPTSSWWQKTLPRLGVHEMTITPLVWDVLTTGLSVTEGAGPFRKLRRMVVPLYGLLYALVRARGSGECYPRLIGESLANVALGYVITGVKRS